MQNRTEKEMERRRGALESVRDELLTARNLPLYTYRTENGYKPVAGEGSHGADIMFIGEAPGEAEAKTGVPFCGRSGKLLDELLATIGLPREEVYITNIVKDRPPENRDPRPDEIAAYRPYLERQIEIIEPKVIATLGRFSMNVIMEQFGLSDKLGPISSLHGQNFLTKAAYGTVSIVPLYHPAVGLYNGSMKETLKGDFQVLKQFITPNGQDAKDDKKSKSRD